ncbi:MAG: 3-ketoacyl-ACP reductase [Cohaesibacter sp.]|nr:3-ketoacyl-ACP reductase [Cohaesibacter sp.]MCV6602014.1 3-ketoacyl-ACP reductase [Cohaesibacter sp.]
MISDKGNIPQVALVTGASRGIGLGIAHHLARAGFSLALNDREDGPDLQSAHAEIEALGVKVTRVVGNVSDLATHEHMFDLAEAALGPVTTLVNNAGVSVLSRGDMLDVSKESFDRCISVNAKALFFLSQTFARRVLARPERSDAFHALINVTSSNAVAASVLRSEYCASKAAAAMISKCFAVRLAHENIAVYDIQPGLIETPMTRVVRDVYQNRIDEEGLVPLARLGQPDDMGAIVASLATGALPYTTGQAISADGGMLISRF